MIPRECGTPLLCSAALALAVTAAPVGAQSQTDLLPYGSALTYHDSESKDHGYTAGLYFAYGTGWKHYLEAAANYTSIDYTDGFVLDQVDLTAAYSRYWAHGALRLGGHLVQANDPLTDGGVIGFGGASVYQPGVWSFGSEASVSSYPAHGSGLTVTQLTPSAGLSAGSATESVGLGLTLRGYYIHLSEEVGLAARDFRSGEAGVSLTRGRVTVSGMGWTGEQAFAVRNAGFLVFNIAELHTGGYGGGARVVLGTNAALSAGLYIERFENPTRTVDASVRSFAFSAGFTL